MSDLDLSKFWNSGWTPEVDLEEALRWCFRHHACVDFFGDENRDVYLRLTTPLRDQDMDCDRATVKLAHHDKVGEEFKRLVDETRSRLGYE